MGLIKQLNDLDSVFYNYDLSYGKTYGLLSERLIKEYRGKNLTHIDLNSIEFNTDTCKREINYYCELYEIKDKSFKKNIEDYLSFLNIDLTLIDKKIHELSVSEKILFYIFLKTIKDYDIYIFYHLFNSLDRNNQKIIKGLLDKLKDNDKIVLLVDSDINNLFSSCDYIIYEKDGRILDNVPTKEISKHLKLLIENDMKVPDVIYLTYLAKTSKKVKLTYYSDVRDVIKDIYKHI